MCTIGLKKANQTTKIWISETTAKEIFEMDELYHFIKYKPTHETRENIYVTTLVSREPRQIVSFDVAGDKSLNRLQNIAPLLLKQTTTQLMAFLDISIWFIRAIISAMSATKAIHSQSKA